MTEEIKQPTEIKFKDKQYKIADLSDRAKACWNHLVDLTQKEHNLRFQMDQVEAARETITRTMEEEVSKDG
jgi:ribosomal protein L16/L10AE